MVKNSKCKICRRQGKKLFIKSERCFSQKCAMIKRAYPPGQKSKRRRGGISEYARQLGEKQSIKNWYGMEEKQFKGYIKDVLKKNKIAKNLSDPSQEVIKKLESRLDNIAFRAGFAQSRALARQMVSHGYFLVNNRKIDIASHRLKKGDEITVNPVKLKKALFQNISQRIKTQKIPNWLELDMEKFKAKVTDSPTLSSVELPGEISTLFEFYSR